MRWPAEYRALAESLGPESPLSRMGAFHPSESEHDPEALADPTGESRFQPVPFVIRKHRDRAVVLATSECFFYCRFCFRRAAPPGPDREPGPEDWAAVFRWLASEPGVEEVILSGGDPLTLDDGALSTIGRGLARIPSLRRWRIHTRAPAVAPGRVTAGLLRSLTGGLPLRLVVHVNHPAELCPSAARALRRFAGASIEVLSQSVLLAGVNDRAELLAELFCRLADLGVEPYYLHHPDRAGGNGRFRVSVERGLQVYGELRCRGDGPVPPYVLDLPCGAGKCGVEDLAAVAEERGAGGRRTRYRWVRPPSWDSLSEECRCEWWDVWERGLSAVRASLR